MQHGLSVLTTAGVYNPVVVLYGAVSAVSVVQ